MNWNRFPPLTSLRAFEAAARNGSYSAAGRELNVSHAAVAQQVKALEAHLGLRLVRREGRGIVPTSDGAMLAERVTQGFEQISATLHTLTVSDSGRALHVTMTPSFAVSWFMPRLAEFREAHPDIDLVVNPTVDTIDLANSECDVAIRFGAGDWTGGHCELLLPSRFAIVASPDLVGADWQGTAADLLRFPWLQELGTEEVRVWLEEQGIEMPSDAHITELPGYMVLGALRAGQGVAVAARVFVEDDLAEGRLVSVHETDDDTPTGYYLYWRRGVERPALKRFLSWIRSAASEDPLA